jgi:hypothetical protein
LIWYGRYGSRLEKISGRAEKIKKNSNKVRKKSNEMCFQAFFGHSRQKLHTNLSPFQNF